MKPESTERRRPARVGAVNYLNTKPLIESLAESSGVELALDLPSRLADSLEAGRLDVALIPSFELFHHPEYVVLSDACIACRGPVMSVKLFFRVPPGDVKTLALDEGSRTSAALARIMLREESGVAPRLRRLPIGDGLSASDDDAVLLIGDRAMRSMDESFVAVWDLGERWTEQTGAPFVFAVWAARPAIDVAPLARALGAARDRGVASVARIAAEQAEAVGISVARCEEYLSENLHFTLGPEERAGLNLFYRRAREMGIAPEHWELNEHGCTASSAR